MEARAEIAVAALRKLAAVQALRGIATLSVVYLHASSQFGGDLSLAAIGNPAVDMFFLISGFIIFHATAAPDTVDRKCASRDAWSVDPSCARGHGMLTAYA